MGKFPNIDAERGRHKMSQQEVADYLNISLGTFKNWMTGKTDIPATSLIRMAKLWNVTADYILGLTNNKSG